jgi:hypothetical protein
MTTKSDKHLTVLDFESLKSQFSPPEILPPETRPDDVPSQGSVKDKGNRKRKASPVQERPGKVVKGSLKDFGLTQIVESGGTSTSPIFRNNESPWDTFRQVFSCKLAGSVIMAIHRTRPSRVLALREYPAEIADRVLQIFRETQHRNILSAEECYRDEGSLYAVVDDLPLTLVHLVGCRAYPSETQLASIITQVGGLAERS